MRALIDPPIADSPGQRHTTSRRANRRGGLSAFFARIAVFVSR